MTTDINAHAHQSPFATQERAPAQNPSMESAPGDAPPAGNRILMRATTRTRGKASGTAIWIAGVVIVLAAIAVGASDWVIANSRRPLLAAAAAPPAAAVSTVPAPTPSALAGGTAPHRKRPAAGLRSERHAARRAPHEARAALEAGADASAVTTVAAPVKSRVSSLPDVTPLAPPIILPPAPTPATAAP